MSKESMSRAGKKFEFALRAELNGDGTPVDIALVMVVLGSLDKTTQMMIRMKYMRGMTDRQIGILLSLPLEEVESRISTGMSSLRDNSRTSFYKTP